MSIFSFAFVRNICTLLLLTATLVLTGCAQNFTPITKQGQQSNVHTSELGICEIFEREPEWYTAAVSMEEKWGTPIPLAMAFVKQESSFIHNARPIKKNAAGKKIGYASSAYGYAQALDGTWGDFKKAVNRRVNRTDFGDSLYFIGWYTNASNQELAFSYKDISNHYLAYHEGRGGFKRGRHEGKTALLNIADKVEKQAKTYKKQLKNCEKALEQNNGSWLFAKK